MLAFIFCLLIAPSQASANRHKAAISAGLLNKTAAPLSTNEQQYFLCSGETLHVGLVGSIVGALFGWTSTSTSSNTTGNTSSGSGDINDPLVNTGTTTDTVTYTVLPTILGILGSPFDIKAIVFPEIKATLSLEDDSNSATICAGDAIGLKITVVGVVAVGGGMDKWNDY